jgi:SAM-dependent methyltransferase
MQDFLYDEMYREEENHWWFKAKRKIILAMVKKYSNGRLIKILDSGCGCGYILPILEQYGEVSALDNNENAIRYSKINFKGEIRKGDLNGEIPYDNNTYDMILSLDVLEHIPDDKLALKNLSLLLKDSGNIIITIPAHMSLWSYHDISHMHYRRYTKKDFISIVKECGLEIEYCSYYNSWLYLPIVCIRKLKNVIFNNGKGENHSDGKMPNRLLNTILYYIFSSELLFIGRDKKLPFGVSLIAVLKNNR